MKECPLCHTKYDGNVSFCVKDGNQLIEAKTENPEDAQIKKSQTNKKEGKGCLKKILITIVVIVVACIALFNYLTNAASYLRLEPDSIAACKAGGECKVDVDYDGYVWVINHKPDWVRVDEYDDHFNISVMPNREGQYREGSITVQSGKHIAQTVIKQLGIATKLSLSETNLKFDKSGGYEYLSLETDGCKWSVSSPEWISVSDDNDGGVKIKCAKNRGQYRTGRIFFKEDNASASIYVTQGGDCNSCSGSGEVTCASCIGTGGTGYGMFYSQCFFCHGAGKFKCSTCNGTGERD